MNKNKEKFYKLVDSQEFDRIITNWEYLINESGYFEIETKKFQDALKFFFAFLCIGNRKKIYTQLLTDRYLFDKHILLILREFDIYENIERIKNSIINFNHLLNFNKLINAKCSFFKAKKHILSKIIGAHCNIYDRQIILFPLNTLDKITKINKLTFFTYNNREFTYLKSSVGKRNMIHSLLTLSKFEDGEIVKRDYLKKWLVTKMEKIFKIKSSERSIYAICERELYLMSTGESNNAIFDFFVTSQKKEIVILLEKFIKDDFKLGLVMINFRKYLFKFDKMKPYQNHHYLYFLFKKYRNEKLDSHTLYRSPTIINRKLIKLNNINDNVTIVAFEKQFYLFLNGKLKEEYEVMKSIFEIKCGFYETYFNNFISLSNKIKKIRIGNKLFLIWGEKKNEKN